MLDFFFNNKNIQRFKNHHSDETLYIIGNGPSLKDINLDLLIGKTTIAMNRIDLIFNKFLWRPTYYFFFSTNIRNKIWGDAWKQSVINSVNCPSTTSFLYSKFRLDLFNKLNNKAKVYWVKKVTEIKPNKNGDINEKCFSTDVSKRVDKSGTSMNIALQFAYYMNFSEIVILGADLGWKRDQGSTNDPNHFDSSYRADISKPIKINNQMRNVHQLALKNFSKYKPKVKIYNGSNISFLDTYPFIDFEKKAIENKIVIKKDRKHEIQKFWNSLKLDNL